MLALTLLIVGLVAALSSLALTGSTVEERASLRSLNSSRVSHLADAGLDVAIQALRSNPRYAGTEYTDLGSGSGGYAVHVTRDGPSRWLIRATGFYPSSDPAAFGYAATTIEAVVQAGKRPGPGYGILGDRSVQFESGGADEASLDSYDSRQGPSTGGRANTRLCTNAHQARAIALLGRVAIRGDVVLGPQSDPDETLWRSPKRWTSIHGSVSVAQAKAALEPVEIPLLPDRGSLSLSGYDVVALPGGLYRFRDIRMTGKSHLVFTGPAQVYVDHEIQIAGGRISTFDNLPPNLALYVTGSQVSINADDAIFAKVNAPYASVELSGNGDLYGAVEGRDILVRGQVDIHYDEALSLYDEALNPSRRGDPLEITLLSWRESDR